MLTLAGRMVTDIMFEDENGYNDALSHVVTYHLKGVRGEKITKFGRDRWCILAFPYTTIVFTLSLSTSISRSGKRKGRQPLLTGWPAAETLHSNEADR